MKIEEQKKILSHFFTFLKNNKAYGDFILLYKEQRYMALHKITNINALYELLVRGKHWDYGALTLTLDAFIWVGEICDVRIPITHTQKWCTMCAKWLIYCKLNDIDVGKCSYNSEIIRLLTYWNEKKWIDYSYITEEEKKYIDNLK